jgi:O-Antigen ligase
MTGLLYAQLLIPYLMALALGVLVPLLVVLSYRSLGIGLAVMAAIIAYEATQFGSSGINLGIHIYPPDVSMGLIAIVTVLRFVFAPNARQAGWGFWLLVGVGALNFAQGLGSFGTAAGVSVRPSFYAYCAILYVSTFAFDNANVRVLQRFLLWCATAMFAVAVYRLTITALDVRDLLPPGGSFQPRGSSIWRVIGADESLILAQAALTLWYFSAGKAWAGGPSVALILLVMTVGLQHRSVWLATLAGVVLVVLARGEKSVGAKSIAALVIVLALVAGALSQGVGGSGLGGDIARSTVDALEAKGTAQERLFSWRQLVVNWAGSGPRQLAAGVPFGTQLERYNSDGANARKIFYEAHNYYVQILVTQGLLGFIALLAIYLRALSATWKARKHDEYGNAATWLFLMLGTQLTFYLTYGVSYMLMLTVGASLALAAKLDAQKHLQTIADQEISRQKKSKFKAARVPNARA